ncbi:hypothetical protein QAD02_010983 [Eretmocerus hayati]|uniref:Uncharacterized protein n=1 Tax=Eretmocerus hayati TaxID=131215 RepID=A0ACC2NVS4_9HYME|nr:hypothetical protein QAD02_010983 [Eretmocerus hayati]
MSADQKNRKRKKYKLGLTSEYEKEKQNVGYQTQQTWDAIRKSGDYQQVISIYPLLDTAKIYFIIHEAGGTETIQDHELQRAIQILREDPFQPAQGLPDLLEIDVCVPTMRKALKERAGLKNHKAATKPTPTIRNSEAGLTYAFQ